MLCLRCFERPFSSCGELVLLLLQSVGSRLWSSVVWGTGSVVPRHAESSQTKDQTYVPCFGREILNHWTTKIRSDQSLSRVQLFATPWIAARQASPKSILNYTTCMNICMYLLFKKQCLGIFFMLPHIFKCHSIMQKDHRISTEECLDCLHFF